MGSFISGSFAPLAFVWLIAAVFLQRDELAAQRQELRQSREVAEQQVNEAKKNVEYVGQQTEFLRQQNKLDMEMRADQDIDKQIQICNITFDRINKELGSTHVFDKDVLQLDGEHEEDPFKRMTLRLRDWNHFADGANEMNSDNGPIEFEREELILQVEKELMTLMEMTQRASVGKRLLVVKMQAEKGIASAHLLFGLNKYDSDE